MEFLRDLSQNQFLLIYVVCAFLIGMLLYSIISDIKRANDEDRIDPSL